MQLSALAIRRAVEVLPTPRTPVIRNAWAKRSRLIALARVWTIASCPISSAKLEGRYLRARTRYGCTAAGAGSTGASTPLAANISGESDMEVSLGPRCLLVEA